MSEEAAAFLKARRHPLELVIFDCDGVLIDSEGVCNRIVADLLTRDGWPMTAEDCERRFIGMSFDAMKPVVEAHLHRSLDPGWSDHLAAIVADAMTREAAPIPGAREALLAVKAQGLAWRIASNSSHGEMRAKFGRVGWMDLVEGRMHSFTDVAAGKPAPDLFLAAARSGGAPPASCLVIEDSVPGATAARAAGMDCLAFVPHGDDGSLRAAVAVPFRSMYDLPALLREIAR